MFFIGLIFGVDYFLEFIAAYPVGTTVVTNRGDEAIVIEQNDEVSPLQIATQAASDAGIIEAKRIVFDLQADSDSKTAILHTNLQQAVRALSLLLDNARKFTQPAEAAVNAGAAVKQGKVVLHLMLQDQLMNFVVEDNGIGVPAEEAEHIFDEFVQLDDYYDGTGIGLTVARSIARRLGGNIVLDTSYSGGARFVFSLPVND